MTISPHKNLRHLAALNGLQVHVLKVSPGAMHMSVVQNAQLRCLLEMVGVNDRLRKCLGRLLREIVSDAASDDMVLVLA